jgi:hypothetical protein
MLIVLTVIQQIIYTKCLSVLISVLDGLAILIKLCSHYIYICPKIKKIVILMIQWFIPCNTYKCCNKLNLYIATNQ